MKEKLKLKIDTYSKPRDLELLNTLLDDPKLFKIMSLISEDSRKDKYKRIEELFSDPEELLSNWIFRLRYRRVCNRTPRFSL